jgi:benzoyl-CoA reductase subunit A
MRVVVGVDLGSTTTKAVLLDEQRRVVGKGITNSRSNYEVACAVAREEALTAARFTMLSRALEARLDAGEGGPTGPLRAGSAEALAALSEAFRLELYLDQLDELFDVIDKKVLRSLGARSADARTTESFIAHRARLSPAIAQVASELRAEAPKLFDGSGARKSDFFRDLAASAYLAAAERVATASKGGVTYELLTGVFDRAILDVETRLRTHDFATVLRRAASRVAKGAPTEVALLDAVEVAVGSPIEEVAFVGTGYGRQTLPFPKQAVRSEILCHGRGAHRFFPGTRTVLDIGGQDTKAIQVDGTGVVTSFQMNDRCAAGCGRYLGYIADELNLGLHELGPLALGARARPRSTTRPAPCSPGPSCASA